jgi:N-acetylmuramoyl-L-alanine amidase
MDVSPASNSGDTQLAFAVSGLEISHAMRGAGAGLVKAWRIETIDDVPQLTLDVSQDVEVAHRFLIPPTADISHFRYVIDLTSALTGVRVAKASLSERTAHKGVKPAVTKLVVIDAGHGGHDPGAQSGDVNEKDITLAAALHLRHRLERSGRYRVVMTRMTDVFVPLEQRVRIARRAGADLFIALHADTAGADPATHGASVYTLSDHGITRVNQVLDGHEWFSHAAARNDPAVNGILLDLTQRSTLNRSNAFAQLLVDRLSAKVDLLPKTHRDAGYFVLLAPDVPAVLLEMGFISNPTDVARLTDPTQRNQLMDAVADTIDTFFEDRVRLAAN